MWQLLIQTLPWLAAIATALIVSEILDARRPPAPTTDRPPVGAGRS